MDSSGPLRADDPGLTDAVARNLAEAVGQFHRHTPGAVLELAPDLVYSDSGLADPTFNAIALGRLEADTARARIGQLVTRMAQTGRPFTWWVDPGATPPDLGARLAAAGLGLAESLPVMVLPLREPPAASATGLVISEVATASQWADFAGILASCWEPPRSALREFLSRARLSALGPGGSGRFLVGYADGVPVCTGEALLYSGVAGLYNIVTRTEHQRRGYATAITAAALGLAWDAGYRTAVLESSPQGFAVYRRLGFEQVGEYRIYALGG